MRNTDDINKIEERLALQKKNLHDLKIGAEASKLLYDLTIHYHQYHNITYGPNLRN